MKVPGGENLERNPRVERPRPPVAPVTTMCILGLRFGVFSGVSAEFISAEIDRGALRYRLVLEIKRALEPMLLGEPQFISRPGTILLCLWSAQSAEADR